ncbi:hypothetical protein D3C76_132100 [compost metagenome]
MQVFYTDKEGNYAMLHSKYYDFYDEEQRQLIDEVNQKILRIFNVNENEYFEVPSSLVQDTDEDEQN